MYKMEMNVYVEGRDDAQKVADEYGKHDFGTTSHRCACQRD